MVSRYHANDSEDISEKERALRRRAIEVLKNPIEESVETRVFKPAPSISPYTREQQLSQDLEPKKKGEEEK